MVCSTSIRADLTIWPSAPQSSIVGVWRSPALCAFTTLSGGWGGGFRWGGVLALSENADCQIVLHNTSDLPR